MGGVLSPLLANVLLDEVDKVLERRGHCFARYADDANVYVRSKRAGERVMALLRRCYAKLHLVVNESKSAVASVIWSQVPRLQFVGGKRESEVKLQGRGKAAGQHSSSESVNSRDDLSAAACRRSLIRLAALYAWLERVLQIGSNAESLAEPR